MEQFRFFWEKDSVAAAKTEISTYGVDSDVDSLGRDWSGS